MEKDFIRDEGKVRRCTDNMSKMNIFEYMYCHIIYWGYFKSFFSMIIHSGKDVIECLGELFLSLFVIVINIIAFIFTPITLVLTAIFQIRNAKKWVERASK